MIESGTGVTSDHGGTNWTCLDMPAIWATLAEHSTDNHCRLVAGWQKIAELSRTHMCRLMLFREELVRSWSPEGSPAAAEYVSRLDHLIASLRQTQETAERNYDVFWAATTAITQSRVKLKELYEKYTAKLREKQEYDDWVAKREAQGYYDLSGQQPPETTTELEILTTRARELMLGLSGELREAQAKLAPSPTYGPHIRVDPDEGIYGGAPPAIPPITPMPVPVGESRVVTSSPASQAVVTPAAPAAGPVIGVNTPGLGLAGATPSLVTPGTGPTIPGLTPSVPSAGPTGGLPPSVPPGLGVVSPPRSLPGLGGGTSPTVRPGAGGMPRGPHALPPGGLIGGAPGVGANRPAAGTGPTPRANPVGGVIGTPSGGPLLGASGRRPGEEHDKRWDPDHPWETQQGVDAVVRSPHAPGRIDPGPAIGLDR